MNVRGGRIGVVQIVEVCAAALLLVSFLLPWFQGAGGSGSQSWISALSISPWYRAPEADLVTLGALVALVGAAASFVRRPRRPFLIVAFVGFAAGVIGLIWTLAEPQNAAFTWGGWGSGASQGIGLWLFAVVAAVGVVIVALDLLPAGEGAAAASQTSFAPTPSPSVLTSPVWGARPAEQPTVAAVPSGAAGRLTVVEGGHSSTLTVNPGDQVVFGRDAAATVHIADVHVSRRHAMVYRSDGTWVVRDLGATNPTRVLGPDGNAEPIQGEVRMASGQLLMGEVLITLYPNL
jgi:hypothetical protein